MAVRIGFVGSGGIARQHFRSLEQVKDAQPVAFADINQERAEEAARRFEGTAYTDFEKMLDKEELDAVYVCLPPHVHQKAELAVAKRGIAMFVEKPLSNKLSLAEKIALAIEENDVITGVGYHHRYYDATARIQKELAAKGTPEPAMLYGRWLGGFPQVPWWRRYEQSGGQVVEQATHIVDMARYLNGEAHSVHCISALREMDKRFDDVTTPDVTALTVQFENGSIGYFAATCINAKNDIALDIYGFNRNWTLTMNSLSSENRETHETTSFTGTNDAFVDEDTQFVKAVKSNKAADIKAIRSNYADALQTLRLTLAANKSMQSGRTVKL